MVSVFIKKRPAGHFIHCYSSPTPSLTISISSCIQSSLTICRGPFSLFFIASAREAPRGAEPRIELGPALHQADALPTELRRTPTELRYTPTKLRRTPTKLRRTLTELRHNTTELRRTPTELRRTQTTPLLTLLCCFLCISTSLFCLIWTLEAVVHQWYFVHIRMTPVFISYLLFW